MLQYQNFLLSKLLDLNQVELISIKTNNFYEYYILDWIIESNLIVI